MLVSSYKRMQMVLFSEYEFNRPMSKDLAIQLTMLETLVLFKN